MNKTKTAIQPDSEAVAQCPFCGGEPKLHEWHFGAVVLCGRCKAKGPEVDFKATRYMTHKLAWKLWNVRFQPLSNTQGGN